MERWKFRKNGNSWYMIPENKDTLFDVLAEEDPIILQAVKINPELKDVLVAVIELEEELEEYEDEELGSIEEE